MWMEIGSVIPAKLGDCRKLEMKMDSGLQSQPCHRLSFGSRSLQLSVVGSKDGLWQQCQHIFLVLISNHIVIPIGPQVLHCTWKKMAHAFSLFSDSYTQHLSNQMFEGFQLVDLLSPKSDIYSQRDKGEGQLILVTPSTPTSVINFSLVWLQSIYFLG